MCVKMILQVVLEHVDQLAGSENFERTISKFDSNFSQTLVSLLDKIMDFSINDCHHKLMNILHRWVLYQSWETCLWKATWKQTTCIVRLILLSKCILPVTGDIIFVIIRVVEFLLTWIFTYWIQIEDDSLFGLRELEHDKHFTIIPLHWPGKTSQ